MSSHNKSFSQILLDCVDEGLSVLGNEPREAVYQFLRTICSLPKEEIPVRIADFASGLRRAIGGASKVIERVILRKLFEKVGSNFRETGDTDFNDYVQDAKRRFEILANRDDESTEAARSKKGQVAG